MFEALSEDTTTPSVSSVVSVKLRKEMPNSHNINIYWEVFFVACYIPKKNYLQNALYKQLYFLNMTLQADIVNELFLSLLLWFHLNRKNKPLRKVMSSLNAPKCRKGNPCFILHDRRSKNLTCRLNILKTEKKIRGRTK